MKEEIILIPIDQIRILNPRHRDRRKFELVIESIKTLGLKKPIKVSVRSNQKRAKRHTIWCAASNEVLPDKC